MFADGYVGTSHDATRIRKQQQEREEQRKKYEALQQKTRDKVASAGLRQFGASKAEAYEAAFKNETVGLVTRDEFMRKRTTIQERMEEEELAERRAAEAAAAEAKEKRKRDKKQAKPKLSFFADEEDEEEAGNEPAPSTNGTAGAPAAEASTSGSTLAAADGSAATVPAAKRPKFSKLGKDPTVSTEFLPDKDREAAEEELRAQLRKEWAAQQEAIRNAPLEITYSYWDGQGHRRKVTVRQGDSIGVFLKAVREQLAPAFRELRAISVDNLMYVKEDIILPHHYTFHELILNKARGKSGPLFDFGVHEDIRITNDASVEKSDTHAGKVVEKHWYDRNKHIFPANRWEVYDPEKAYDRYTVHDRALEAQGLK